MIIFVEIANILEVCLAYNQQNVIMNFIALSVIAEFDDNFFEALP